MRVDPFFVLNLSGALDQTQATQQQLSQELSSGVRVTTIGSDPVAAAENVQLLNQIEQDDSYTQTTSLATGQLQVADSTLSSVVTQLNQAITLASQGSNGTLDASELKAISSQLSGIRDEVLSLANSSFEGQYLFAGAQTGATPFTLDNSTSPATVTYHGDNNVNTLTSPDGQSINLNVPGNQIFTSSTANVFAALNNLIADFANGTPDAGATDTSALNSALNYVSQQQVSIDNSISRVSNASSAASSAAIQLTAVQTNLIQADLPSISTQLSLSQSQQTALINVIAALGQGSLFDKLP
jgi:flagellar hook-associated protein 3 FlgL